MARPVVIHVTLASQLSDMAWVRILDTMLAWDAFEGKDVCRGMLKNEG